MEGPVDVAPLTAGLQGDLQTVVQALQALTIKLGDLIAEFHSSTTGHAESIGDAIAALADPKQYFHISAAGSFLVYTPPDPSAPAILYGVTANHTSATTTLTVYDGTSTGGAVVSAITFVSGQGFDFGPGLLLSNGLYVVAAGTPCDLTLIWNTG
jgi:hypothetical protein